MEKSTMVTMGTPSVRLEGRISYDRLPSSIRQAA
jgi:hypothetical protein